MKKVACLFEKWKMTFKRHSARIYDIPQIFFKRGVQQDTPEPRVHFKING
jgi:hypothetical protein